MTGSHECLADSRHQELRAFRNVMYDHVRRWFLIAANHHNYRSVCVARNAVINARLSAGTTL
jgi:hypothetical protein